MEGVLTSGFGYRISPLTSLDELHDGLDIAAEIGTRALAVSDGVILEERESDSWGKMLRLDVGDGTVVLYAHLSGYVAEVGDSVEQGEPIALTGDSGASTGPHLHLGVYEDGEAVDPAQFLDAFYVVTAD